MKKSSLNKLLDVTESVAPFSLYSFGQSGIFHSGNFLKKAFMKYSEVFFLTVALACNINEKFISV